jgi:DNA polymerase III epsilon subunit-like protein
MIVVDVETTGINARKNSIVSIGAVDYNNPGNQFYEECKIWDGAEIDPKALEINGFTEEELKYSNKQSVREIVKNFVYWTEDIENKTFAGQNPRFDLDFISVSANKTGLKHSFGYRTIDLHGLCFSHYLTRGLKPPIAGGRTDLYADKIFEYVGLPPEPKPHNALTGAKFEAEAFSRLIVGKNLLEEFRENKIPDYLVRIR